MTALTHSACLNILAWVVSGGFTVAAGLTVAELATMFPETGGAVKYLEHTYGKLVGFLFGWGQILIYYPANIAALSIIFGTQAVNLLGIDKDFQLPIAIGVGLMQLLVHLFGTKAGAVVQQIATVLKIIPVVLIIVFGLLHQGPVEVSLFPVQAGGDKPLLTALASAVLASMFAFDGWMSVGNISGEMKRPEKDLVRAIVSGLLMITFLYIAISMVFLNYLPIGEIAGNQNTASQVASLLFGKHGGKLVTIGILISVYGTANGYTLTGSRVPFALGEEGILPFSKQWVKLNRFGSPFASILLIISLSIGMMFVGSFDLLTDLLIFVTWIFSFLLFQAVFILRKRLPDVNRPYKVWGYPIIPIIALIGAVTIMGITLLTQPILALIGIVVTGLGIPVYLIRKNKQSLE
jgi:APA family basic amino acid/polyamine antiporter